MNCSIVGAAQALTWIAKLYEIESHIKDHPPDRRLLTLQTQPRPVLNQFHAWLAGHTHRIPTHGELGQAFGHALRQWATLTEYANKAILMPDNAPKRVRHTSGCRRQAIVAISSC